MDNKILIKNQNGESIECDVLFTFDSTETNKSYIVYTDNTKDELGNTKVYANTYDAYSESGSLGQIETDEEWATIESIFASINDSKESSEKNE
ncbi:MAG: DUF1292 domain-containing protein [Bacilli bacterium]|nr:DUF1292 domain-containing protein [Bacilli bacterium]